MQATKSNRGLIKVWISFGFGIAVVVMSILIICYHGNLFSALGAFFLGIASLAYASNCLWEVHHFKVLTDDEEETGRNDVKLCKAIVEGEVWFDGSGIPGRQNYTVEFYAQDGISYLWRDNDANKLNKLCEYTESKKPNGHQVRIIEVLGLFAFGHPSKDQFIFAQEGFICQEFTYQEFVKYIYDVFGK